MEVESHPRDIERPNDAKSFLLELPGLLLAALIVAVLIKTFIIQPFYIPSGSMIPTLQLQDRVMVSKLNYQFGEVNRGDIVVFETGPDVEETIPQAVIHAVMDALGIPTAGNEDLIKRVIAVEGDNVSIADNHVVVNGVALEEPYVRPDVDMSDMPERQIAPDELWVMGDNRNDSSDSRFIGPIEEADVVGEAILRIWPLDRLGSL